MPSRPIRLIVVAGMLAAALTLPGTATAASPDVTIADLAYSPATVTVTAGDTVTWTNNDSTWHTASRADWATGVIFSGATGSITFAKAGTFTYTCTIHPAMRGTIVVQAASARVTHGDGTIPPVTDSPTGGGSSGMVVGALLALAAVAGMRVGMRRFGHVRVPQAKH